MVKFIKGKEFVFSFRTRSLTADGTSNQPSQVGLIWQVAILASEHAEVGRVVPEKPEGRMGNERRPSHKRRERRTQPGNRYISFLKTKIFLP